MADRRRVRVVVADFKYPMLRLEESVITDPQSGEETVRLIRASVADHVMVGLAPGTDIAEARMLLETNGYRIRSVEPDSFVIAEVAEPSGADAQLDAIREISGLDEFISFAEPDYIVFPSLAPNDPDYASGKMWGLNNRGNEAGSVADADIDAPEAWELRNSAPGVVVAVTDTGIQYNHEDLLDNMWSHPTSGVHGFDAYDDDSDPMDTGGHGTHCAGTIGARGNNSIGTAGVAWQVQLMALRFLGPNGGSTSDGIRVINYARLNGAHIISASWGGGGYSQSLYNAINACRAADIPFVAAAGNDGTNNDSIPHYPSSYDLPNIVAVASTTKADNLSSFSCYGKHSVDIAAPGSSIWSSYIGGNSSYEYLNGTSMATPHVSGALALAKAHFPGETYSQLTDRLYSSADRVNALAEKTYSGGRLNLDRLLRGLQPSKRHDDFADALRFENGYGRWSGTSEGASHEPDEWSFSINGLGNQSLWFAFNTGLGGLVSLDCNSPTAGFNMVTFEGGTKGSLIPVAYSNAVSSYNRQIRFNAKPNTEYRVLLDTYNAGGQIFSLVFSQTPGNDFFASATPISGKVFNVSGTNRGATPELFELTAPHAGAGQGKSVWWRWIAPKSDDFIISTSGSDFDTVLAVYTGSSTAALSAVASNDDRSPLDFTSQVTFRAVANTTYHIAVDSFRAGSAGNIRLNGFASSQLIVVRQPQSQMQELGKRAEFDVSVLSGGAISYQWFLNGKALPGKTSSSIVIDPVRQADFGDYTVQAYNSENSVHSEIASLGEILTPPVITWKSGDTAVAVGDTLRLGVLASGSGPITYRWEKDGTPLPGKTTAHINLAEATLLLSGNYKCIATNGAGNATASMRVNIVESPFDSFAWSREGVSGSPITDLKVIDGKCYAVSGDKILVSENGDDWTEWRLPAGFEGFLVAKRGSEWFCTGFRRDGKQAVAISGDGLTWADPVQMTGLDGQTGSTGIAMSQLESFAGRLVGVSHAGAVMHSADGISWTFAKSAPAGAEPATFYTSSRIYRWGGKLYLPSGVTNGKTTLLTSLDGAVWSETDLPPDPSGQYTGKGEFVASCGGVLYLVAPWGAFSSSDGVTWEFEGRKRSLSLGNTFRFAETGEGCFAFVLGTQSFHLASSANGWGSDTGLVSRTIQPLGSQNFTSAVAFNGRAVFGTENGLLKSVSSHGDVALPNQTVFSLDSIQFMNGEFLAYRSESTSVFGQKPVLISGDGKAWRQGRSFQGTTEFVRPAGASIGGRYFGDSGNSLSPAGAGWAPSAISAKSLPLGLTKAVSSAAFDGTRWLALAQSTIYSVTADGKTWTPVSASGYTPGSRDKILRFKDRWYAMFPGNFDRPVYSSADGITWTQIPLLQISRLTVFGDKLCGVTADGSRVHISGDGITWTSFPTNHAIGPTGIGALSLEAARLEEFNGSLVLLIRGKSDGRGFLFFSNDGEVWVNAAVSTGIRDFVVGNGTFCLVTNNGGILTTRENGVEALAAPIVSINSPVHKSVHVNGSTVEISGTAINPDGGPLTTDCFVDGVLLGNSSTATFRFSFRPSDPAGHVVTVRSRGTGNLMGSDELRVSVTSPQLDNRLETGDGEGYAPIVSWTTFGNRVYAVDAYSLRRSSVDGGWENMILPSLPAAITNIVSGNGTLIVQTSKGALVTRDGVNWFIVDGLVRGFNGTRGNIIFRDGWFSTVTGTSPPYTAYSRDGLSWNISSAFPISTIPVAPVVVSEKVLLTSPPYRSVDGGVNWIAIPELAVANSHLTSFAMAFGKAFAALPDGRLFASTDAGATWQESHSFGALPAGHASRISVQHGRLYWGEGGYWLASSADGENWESFTGEQVLSSRIESINGLLAAPGFAGMVWSADGLAWEKSPSAPRNPVRDLIGRDGASLLQGDSAGGMWRSMDGMNWERSLDGRPPELSGLFMDVSDLSPVNVAGRTVYGIPYYGLHHSSIDGRSWNQGTFNGGPIPGNPQLGKLWSDESIAFAGMTRYAPVDGADANELWTSADGMDWSQLPAWRHGVVADMEAYDGLWIALAKNGDVRITTDEGISWSDDRIPGLMSGIAMARFAGRWVAFGTEQPNGQGPIILYSSENGENWIRNGQITTDPAGSLVSVAASDQAMVVLFSIGHLYTATDFSLSFSKTATTSSIYTQFPPRMESVGNVFYLEDKLVSVDGVTWQVPAKRGSYSLTPAYYFGGKYYSFPYYSSPHWSLDGLNWTAFTGADTTFPYMPMVSQGVGSLRARDSKGAIWETTDGISFHNIADGPASATNSTTPRKIIHFGSRLLVGGSSGLMLSSPDDGATWEPALLNGQRFPAGMDIRKLVASDAEAMAIHTVNGNTFPPVCRYFRTTDGVNWTENTELADLKLLNAVPSGNRWIGILGNGGLLESTDGALTWHSLGTIPNILYGYEISIFNGLWVAACSSGTPGNNLTIYTSPDGNTWTNRHITTYSTSSGSEFFNAHGLLYFGNGPASQRSADGMSWAAFDKPSGLKYMIPVGEEFLGLNSSGDTSYFSTAPGTGGAWKLIDPYQNQITAIGTPDGSRVFLFGTGIIKELVRNDLAISFPAPAAGVYGVGDEVMLDVSLRNLGSAASAFPDSLPFEAWLSSDGFFGDGNDIFIGSLSVPVSIPSPGEETTIGVGFMLPNEIAPGNQRIVLKLATEGLLSESNRANNVFISDTASIDIPEWEFSVATNGNGQVNRDFAATRYPHKSRVSLTASAGKGAVFAGWAGDAFSPNNQITVLMDGDKSVQANFSGRAALQLFVRGMGTVTGLADLGSYPVGATAALSAEPAQGWTFSHWSGASSDTTASTSVLMDSPKVLTAIFVRSLSDWKQSVFTAAELADSSISGDGSDPDGDALKNWQEHLHGSNPTDRASTGVVSLTLDGDFLRCVYTRLSSPASGTPIRCEAGRAMSDWDSPDLEERVISTIDGIETIESRLPHGTNPRGFIRFSYVPEAP